MSAKTSFRVQYNAPGLDATPASGDESLSEQPFRILSCDGGGGRGMITAVLLKKLEEATQKPCFQLFDRMAGTSTGAILACGLSTPRGPQARGRRAKFTAEEIVEIYRELGSLVFARGELDDRVMKRIDGEILPALEALSDGISLRELVRLPRDMRELIKDVRTVVRQLTRPAHDINRLAWVLSQKLGHAARLKDALTELYTYTYDVEARVPLVLGSAPSTLPGNHLSADWSNVRMWQAATASSSSPPYFQPFTVHEKLQKPTRQRNPSWPLFPRGLQQARPDLEFLYPPTEGTGQSISLIDGGNAGMADPALLALLEESEKSAKHSRRVVLSIGTGHYERPIQVDDAERWGAAQWILEGELLNSLLDGAADATNVALRALGSADNVVYVRWQPSIPKDFAVLDTGDADDMEALEGIANAFIGRHSKHIKQVADALSDPSDDKAWDALVAASGNYS